MKSTSQQKKKLQRGLAAALAVCLLVSASILYDYAADRRRWTVVQTGGNAAENPQSETAAERETGTGVDQPPVKADSPVLIPVYLVGAVRQPGIYQVETGSYLYELVEQAGGLAPDAALAAVNLAMRIDHNQQIYIPTEEEVAKNPSLLPGETDSSADYLRIDLNQAGQAELEQLPGIGPVTARAILDYRRQNGPFARPEDLMLVPGIKESRYTALKDYIYVH